MSMKESISSGSGQHCPHCRRSGANFYQSGLQANADLHLLFALHFLVQWFRYQFEESLRLWRQHRRFWRSYFLKRKKFVSKPQFDYVRPIGISTVYLGTPE